MLHFLWFWMSLASELNINITNSVKFAIDGDIDYKAQSQKLHFLQAHVLTTFSESFPSCHIAKILKPVKKKIIYHKVFPG